MKTQVAIVGGGPGGSATAHFLALKGISSVIIERESFPRYHIGESTIGECGACLRLLGLEEQMREGGHPIKYGTKVYGPSGKNSFYIPVMKRTEQGLEPTTTWQVRRSDFDLMLLQGALKRGAKLVAGSATDPLRNENNDIVGVQAESPSGELMTIRSDVLVDASGQGTFLCQKGITSEKCRGSYDNQIAIFSQVQGAIRDEGPRRDDTLIFYREKNHWAWFIPLDDELVSVGITVPSEYFQSKAEGKEVFLTRELHSLNSELTRRLPHIDLFEEVRAISNYSYHIRRFTGRSFLCVGDSHRFVDPIFSFGVFFAIKEAQFAADAIESYLRGTSENSENPFAAYEQLCEKGQDCIQTLIDGFWNHPIPFAFFAHSRYRDEFIDMFAGRIYHGPPNGGELAIRNLNERTGVAGPTMAS